MKETVDILSLENYNIHVGNVVGEFRAFLKSRNYSSYFVLVDENTKAHCLPILTEALTEASDFLTIEIQSGEIHKNIDTCGEIWEAMMNAGADRLALVINLGGGVIGDMGGFCASTFKRGVEFVQVPTTLLSQVDASIGGKLGIDFLNVKNSVGVFNDPQAVFIDPIFLNTLSGNEIRSGYAEIIKHSLIADHAQWQQLQQIENLSEVDWAKILIPSLTIKKEVVTQDPFEKGWRKALNFGHTIGHGIEGVLLNSEHPLLHGEAIAIGMICESYLSMAGVGFDESHLKEVVDYMLKIYGKVELYEADFEEMIHLMRKDKKNENNQINFTMLKRPGQALINQICTEPEILESLRYYNSL